MLCCYARNDGDLELLDPELHSPEMLKCVWEDAITDIAVVRSVQQPVCFSLARVLSWANPARNDR